MWTWAWLRGELSRTGGGELATLLPALVDDGVLVDAIRAWVIHTSLPGLLALLGEHELQAHLARLRPALQSGRSTAQRAIDELIAATDERRAPSNRAMDIRDLLSQARACVSYRESHPTINQFRKYLSWHLIEPGGRDDQLKMRPHLLGFAAQLRERAEDESGVPVNP